MNAIDFLKGDHQHIRELFDEVEPSDDISERRELFSEIKQDLYPHMEAEETALYPMLDEREDMKGEIEESYDEHQEIKDIIEEMEGLTDDNEWDNRFEELIDAVEHHVAAEEAEVFAKMEKTFNKEQLDRIGAELEEVKRSEAA